MVFGFKLIKRLSTLSVLCLFLASFVLALHVISTFTGSTSFTSRAEEVSTTYNFTINNTDAATTANITQINITLPSGFTFTGNTNGTNAGGHTFVNTSSVLSWTNATGGIVTNLTWRYFSFNATASLPGTWNFTVVTVNSTGVFTNNTISIVINDTTATSVIFASPGQTISGNVTSLSINASATDEGILNNITLRVFNSTQSQVNISSSSSSAVSYYVNFAGLSDGVYYVNVTSNDSFGNQGNTSTLRLVLDTAVPTVTLDDDDNTRTSISFDVSSSDGSGSGVSGSCTIDSDDGGTVDGFDLEGLSCSTSYTVTASCTDYAGNIGTDEGDFSTVSCDSGGSSSSSSGSGSSGTTWTNTYSYDNRELSTLQPVIRALGNKERVRLLIGGQQHSVGVVSITGQQATIEIASTPQTVQFTPGQTKQFEVTGDNYYDLSVTLLSISSNRANVTIQSVHEYFNSTITSPSSITTNGTSEENINESGRSAMGYIVLIVLILVAAGAGAYYYYIKRKRRLGFI